MRFRSRLLMITSAAVAGFFASRPDLRELVSQEIRGLRQKADQAVKEGKEEAYRKEIQLYQEIKGPKRQQDT